MQESAWEELNDKGIELSKSGVYLFYEEKSEYCWCLYVIKMQICLTMLANGVNYTDYKDLSERELDTTQNQVTELM